MAASSSRYQGALNAYVKLVRAHDAVERRIMVREPLPAGMTETQFGVLEALLHKGPLTHHEVAEKILKTRGNITSVVDQLERAELVVRRRCDVDRRRVFLELTEEGTRTARTAFARMRTAIEGAMTVLEPHELVELGRLCRKLGKGNDT